MKVLDLFSGIGGFSLGLERAGMETVAFCEMDRHCQMVLQKHWPEIPIVVDVKKLSMRTLKMLRNEAERCARSSHEMSHPPRFESIDVICGGFPCQDISVGGSQKGISKGTRSSLWKEYWRLIDEIRPKYAIIENVERLRKNGLGIVLNDLSKIGYDAEWHCLTAHSFGLPHQRDRLFLVAYNSEQRQHECSGKERHIQTDKVRESEEIHSEREQCQLKPGEIRSVLSRGRIDSIRNAYSSEFSTVSKIRRVTDGIPTGMDESARKQRIKQLGNAVIPQIAEAIGLAIMENERRYQ